MNELGQLRAGGVGVHQGGVSLKAQAQRRDTRKHPVLVGRQFAQHHGQRRLIKILHIVGGNAHTHGARPVGDLGQLATQVGQNLLGLWRVMVGDVEQGQRGCVGIAVQRHLRTQLG